MVVTIDTSALLSVLVNEPHKQQIIKLTRGCTLQAPASLDAEVGNALSAMLKRNRITYEVALEVIHQFRLITISRVPIQISSALKLSDTFNIYAYDAYVLDCASANNTALLSLDKQLIVIARELQIPILEVPT